MAYSSFYLRNLSLRGYFRINTFEYESGAEDDDAFSDSLILHSPPYNPHLQPLEDYDFAAHGTHGPESVNF